MNGSLDNVLCFYDKLIFRFSQKTFVKTVKYLKKKNLHQNSETINVLMQTVNYRSVALEVLRLRCAFKKLIAVLLNPSFAILVFKSSLSISF